VDVFFANLDSFRISKRQQEDRAGILKLSEKDMKDFKVSQAVFRQYCNAIKTIHPDIQSLILKSLGISLD
jgi:hypothetical protein